MIGARTQTRATGRWLLSGLVIFAFGSSLGHIGRFHGCQPDPVKRYVAARSDDSGRGLAEKRYAMPATRCTPLRQWVR